MNSFNKTSQIVSFPLLVIHLHFLLFILLSITLCPLSSHGCHEEERRALLSFKSSLDDPANRLSTWEESIQHRNCCAWQGIQCSNESLHVISIDLRNTVLEGYIIEFSDHDIFDPPSTSLRGKLSPSLLSINHLEYLDLGFNDFQQSDIAFQFSNLTKLTHLDLSFSNFSMSITTQFNNLSFLEYLDLSCVLSNGEYFDFDFSSYFSPSCLVSSSIKWVRGLTNLRILRLSGVDLFEATSSKEFFSEHISYLSDLRDLDISGCDISGPDFPVHQFHNLSRLSTLKMNFNFIRSSIPIQMANLTSLSILELSRCDLHGSFPYLPQLKELDVSDNFDLQTDLSRMFEHQWPRLQTLDISFTNAPSSLFILFTDASGSIPSSISNAPQLVSLSASFCSFQGSLPSSIYNLSRLQRLDLSQNQITGYIPSSISNLTYLNHLDLFGNQFQGHVLEAICKMSSLRYLDLGYNSFTGTIPSCITNLRNLRVFEVSGNSIGGTISLISLINGLNLTYLGLGQSRLTIVIDQHLHPYTKLQTLRLESCGLEGFIPAFICNLTDLRYLDLSANNLTGAIPPCISKLKNLNYLDLADNNLRGPFPVLPPGGLYNLLLSNNKLNGEISIETGEILSNVEVISLDNNELSGSLPSTLCSQKRGMSYTKTHYINLFNNRLSGSIPSSIGYCTSLAYLSLGNNNLTGNVPNELQLAEHLQRLVLNNNNLNGTFPMFIQKLLSLKFLNIGNNNFEGIIPPWLGSLSNLMILSLRSNRFNGSIPEEILHLQELEILDLSFNNFSGPIPLKLGNLTKLTRRSVTNIEYDVQYQLAIKGTTAQFKQFRLGSGMDLSSNSLNGSIPEEIQLLQGLGVLNLSHNLFSGIIPASVGNMSSLKSLDLSSNRLSGHIPQSLTSIDSLEILSLSYNNLSGKIPRGEHFDTLSLDGFAFAGNDFLCGFPTKIDCEDDRNISSHDTNLVSSKVAEDDGEDAKEKFLFYAIVAMGCAVGFWGLFIVLFLRKQKWWFPYWRLVDSVAVRIVESIHKQQ